MADDLISRSELRAAAIKATAISGHDPSEFSFDNCYPYWQFSKCIKDAPVVDAVPVVRCAQCKWWTPKDGTWKSFGDCSEMAERYTEDCESDMDCQTGYNDFCSCGERKE